MHFMTKSLRYADFAQRLNREETGNREKEELDFLCVSNGIGEP